MVGSPRLKGKHDIAFVCKEAVRTGAGLFFLGVKLLKCLPLNLNVMALSTCAYLATPRKSPDFRHIRAAIGKD